jgi:hypothetical protein
MQTKKCFKCGRELPLSEFYKHPQTGDGHLNKCKECTKNDVHKDYIRKSSDEQWMEKERARGREKFKRLGYKNKTTRTDFPGNENICRMLKVRGYDTKGKEAHHWNYNLPYSVFLISRRAHHRIHNAVIMSREDKFCYTKDGIKIKTAEQAKSVYESILANSGINEEIQLIEFEKWPTKRKIRNTSPAENVQT